jgi:hypothetical protein
MGQQEIKAPTIAHLKKANAIITRAKKHAQGMGLVFPALRHPLKLSTVCDSSHANKESSYAQEGVLVLLMHDKKLQVYKSDSPLYYEVLDPASQLAGRCHILAHISHKAKRISSSTSTAETLAATIGKELAQLVTMRLTEVFCIGRLTDPGIAPTLSQLIHMQELGAWEVPIDHYTDCRDVFLLIVGNKGVPQDRYQRLYVLSLREDRIRQNIRLTLWIPTEFMVADALTKTMNTDAMRQLLTTGHWQWPTKKPSVKTTTEEGVPSVKSMTPLVAPPIIIQKEIAEQDIIDIHLIELDVHNLVIKR